MESLTILNASRVLSLVADMLEEMQRALGSHFQPKTVVGLNLHISCLIERLVKKEEIKSYRELERFCEEHRDFVALARRCFANIAEQHISWRNLLVFARTVRSAIFTIIFPTITAMKVLGKMSFESMGENENGLQ